MKQLSIFIILIIIFHIHSFAQQKSKKRGIAYNITGVSDLKALSPGISWFYNWSQVPGSSVKPYLVGENVQYLPMIWNGTQGSIDAANLYYPTDTNNGYLLGFNEPNFPDQANMTPSVAAAFWPKLELLANTYNLKLVAPAVNYSGGIYDSKYGKTMYQDPYSYLDEFFKECPNCKVDYIAVHWYGHGGLETIVTEMWNKYKKPIWVTEFSSWDPSVNPMTLQLEKDFMVKYVDWLENNPNVFRYAWFTGRASNNDYIDILGSSGELTELGSLYVNMPVHDPSYYKLIPARIEAENYTSMSGIQLQTTSDADGLLNVGWIDAGDFLEYNLDIHETRVYPLKIRYSSTKSTQISIQNGQNIISLINLTNTNSYNNWQTIETTLNLASGKQTLRFEAKDNGFNINWIQFGDVASNLEDISENRLKFKLKNSLLKDGKLTIISNSRSNKAKFNKIEIIDITGKTLISKKIQLNQNKEFNINLNELEKLPTGLYFIRLSGKDGIFSDKFVVE